MPISLEYFLTSSAFMGLKSTKRVHTLRGYHKYKIKLTDDRQTFLGIQSYVYSISLTWL